MITIRCSSCGKRLKAEYGQRGRLVRCPVCGRKFTAEAVGWWERVLHDRRGNSEQAASDEAGRKAKQKRAKGVRRPYQHINLADLEGLPGPHRTARLLMILGVVVVVLGVIAIGAWVFSRGEPSGKERAGSGPWRRPKPVATARAGGGRKPERRPAGDTPPEETTQKPAEVEMPPLPVSRSLREPVDMVPDYAYELDAHIRVAGYRPRKGFVWANADGYCCRLVSHPHVYFSAYPQTHRILCAAFAAYEETASKRATEQAVEQDILSGVLKRFVGREEQPLFVSWLQLVQRECARAYDAGRAFARECRFRDKVIRVEMATCEERGRGIRVEVARDYRPSTAVAGQPAVRTWKGMRRGVTLSEVETFAGPGKRSAASGSGEWLTETYVWPGDAQVTFRNGRAIEWKAAAVP